MSESSMSEIKRPEPSYTAGEWEMLTGFLDYHRATLELKCQGLGEEQLKARAVPTSNLSLLGLVRHLADVERGWFRIILGGERIGYRYYTKENRDRDFNDLDDLPVAEAFAAWREEIALAREVVAAKGDLDALGTEEDGRTFSLRWILTHMIEEYARHNGHADLIREAIDGVTGE